MGGEHGCTAVKWYFIETTERHVSDYEFISTDTRISVETHVYRSKIKDGIFIYFFFFYSH